MRLKQCKGCNEKFDKTHFPTLKLDGTLKQRSDGRVETSHLCFSCFEIRKQKYNDREKRDWRYYKYGVTQEEFESMRVLQNNSCKICNTPFDIQKPYVDHCHSTKEVRGLLCHNCNLIIGHAKDDLSVLEKAISYLK